MNFKGINKELTVCKEVPIFLVLSSAPSTQVVEVLLFVLHLIEFFWFLVLEM